MGKLSRVRGDFPHLDDAQFRSLILGETEAPGTSDGATAKGAADFLYLCPNCKSPLFSSAAKFASGTGWPSFYEALRVMERKDWRLFQHGQVLSRRKEVLCRGCRGHLGHVFRGENWDTPTGVRYCINSSSICRQVSE